METVKFEDYISMLENADFSSPAAPEWETFWEDLKDYRPKIKSLLGRLYRPLAACLLAAGVYAGYADYARAQTQPCELEPPYEVWGTLEIDGVKAAVGRPTKGYIDENHNGRFDDDPEHPNKSDTPETIDGGDGFTYYDFITNGGCGWKYGDNIQNRFDPVWGSTDPITYTAFPLYTAMNDSNNITREDRKITMYLEFVDKNTIRIYLPDEGGVVDIARGNLNELEITGGAVNLGGLTCIGDNLTGTPGTTMDVTDASTPLSGQGWFYVVRPAWNSTGLPNSPHYGYAYPGLEPRTDSTGGDCPP